MSVVKIRSENLNFTMGVVKIRSENLNFHYGRGEKFIVKI